MYANFISKYAVFYTKKEVRNYGAIQILYSSIISDSVYWTVRA